MLINISKVLLSEYQATANSMLLLIRRHSHGRTPGGGHQQVCPQVGSNFPTKSDSANSPSKTTPRISITNRRSPLGTVVTRGGSESKRDGADTHIHTSVIFLVTLDTVGVLPFEETIFRLTGLLNPTIS